MNLIEGRRLLMLVSLALMMSLVLSACDEGDAQLVKDFAEEWARSKNIDPSTPEGLANIGARTIFGTSTGDEVSDAAIDAGTVVKNMADADALAEKGNLADIDRAIKLRPQDYTYRSSRGVMVLASRADAEGARVAFDEADKLAAAQGKRAQELNLRHRLNLMLPSVTVSPNPSNPYYSQYCRDSQQYSLLTGSKVYPTC